MDGVSATKNGSKVHWAAVQGQWEITESSQQFLGKGPSVTAHGQSFPLGIALTNKVLQNGKCRVTVRFAAPFAEDEQVGGVVLGYRSLEQHYVFAELGAARSAYSVGEFVSGLGWRSLAAAGQLQNLQPDRDYDLQIELLGQELKVQVDEVPVLQHLLAHPLEGRQIGLIAAGSNAVSFSNFVCTTSLPRAFVVMQFAEPYDTFYRDVIQRQARDAGFDVKAGPGAIIQDLQREIEQSEIVIAEITPPNPNVFYELGYAHALGKPTILLAQRGAELPFDIRGFRVVFYSDTIGGKGDVERSLRKHLDAITSR
ncbi:MAG: hypothetical protein ABSB35_15555 [Bryobacteraceae bacterium]|jgi:hypothetical protein